MTDVNTVRVIDPRIEPPARPAYAVNIGPTQNQVYRIKHSGISNSYIAFNNITTLGTGRAFQDTFEIEITAQFTITCTGSEGDVLLGYNEWTFDSFPFNKCCEEIRANINGGAFFSAPMYYLRAKERYWDTKKVMESYGNICPCEKPWVADENMQYSFWGSDGQRRAYNQYMARWAQDHSNARLNTINAPFALTSDSCFGSTNKSIIPFTVATAVQYIVPPSASTEQKSHTYSFELTWREPVFCPPFSSRMDETFGQPLYNITSIDLVFHLQDLRNMIVFSRDAYIPALSNITINLTQAHLCYQVLSIPDSIVPPTETIVPYRRFVPYVTDIVNQPDPAQTDPTWSAANGICDGVKYTAKTSGVYSLNEIPEAIWVYVSVPKAHLQVARLDAVTGAAAKGFNKLFCPLTRVSLNMANTTQIFNTYAVPDLYRMAKDNGCQDTYENWAFPQINIGCPSTKYAHTNAEPPVYVVKEAEIDPATGKINGWDDKLAFGGQVINALCAGTVGSVLRVIPGKDILLPDQQLVPGANADNMVFQAEVDYILPNSWPTNFRATSLWLLFEYVGVAVITPGQCRVSMNPLGNGNVLVNSLLQEAPINPPVRPFSNNMNGLSTMEGSGWWDNVKKWVSNHGPELKYLGSQAMEGLKKSGWVSSLASLIPGIGSHLGPALASVGWGEKACKRSRKGGAINGGAVMGLGDFT